MIKNHSFFFKLAFNIAKINLGKTKLNPTVGCVVVKNDSVISSGVTSIGGRPHAEFNALNFNKDFKNSDLYVTMEPCTHYGLTPPCLNTIIQKGVKRIFYSFDDVDNRTAKKLSYKTKTKKITVIKKKYDKFNDFYQSYYPIHNNDLPFIDAKIAVSKDYYTINKKSKWITNSFSRKRAHLIRSEYDAIISTSKSINKDNSLLNCRLNGLDNLKPDLIIVDLNLDIKRNLSLFKRYKNRKIFIITTISNAKKRSYLLKNKVKIININSLKDKKDFIILFKILKEYKYNRILVESGLSFLNELLKNGLIFNLYLFRSSTKLKKFGSNNASNILIKKFKLKEKVKVNLKKDNLYKIKIK